VLELHADIEMIGDEIRGHGVYCIFYSDEMRVRMRFSKSGLEGVYKRTNALSLLSISSVAACELQVI
jgi:hypothetical protein